MSMRQEIQHSSLNAQYNVLPGSNDRNEGFWWLIWKDTRLNEHFGIRKSFIYNMDQQIGLINRRSFSSVLNRETESKHYLDLPAKTCDPTHQFFILQIIILCVTYLQSHYFGQFLWRWLLLTLLDQSLFCGSIEFWLLHFLPTL